MRRDESVALKRSQLSSNFINTGVVDRTDSGLPFSAAAEFDSFQKLSITVRTSGINRSAVGHGGKAFACSQVSIILFCKSSQR